MARYVHATEPCPFHQAYDVVRRSETVRFLGVLQLAALRVMRSVVDRRLERLTDRGQPAPRADEEVVRITVSSERPLNS